MRLLLLNTTSRFEDAMFDDKFLKLLLDSGLGITALVLGYKILVLVMDMWRNQQDTQQKAFEHQRKEHEVQTELLNRAHNKLDNIATKVAHR